MSDPALLERRANVVRSRLLRAVDALDARRHHVTDVALHAKQMAVPAVIAVATIGALFGASAYAFGAAIRRRRRHSLADGLAEIVRDLDLARRPSFARRAAERVVLSLLGYAATEVARRATKVVIDGRLLGGRQLREIEVR